MKKILFALIISCATLISACANDASKINMAATATAPWKVGDIVAKDTFNIALLDITLENKNIALYRKFLGITKQGHYLVQDFYQDGDQIFSNPYRIVNRDEVTTKPQSIDGAYTIWHQNTNKALEINYSNGVENGLLTQWYDNGQKFQQGSMRAGKLDGEWSVWFKDGKQSASGHFDQGTPVGVERSWDIKGNLISEIDQSRVNANAR